MEKEREKENRHFKCMVMKRRKGGAGQLDQERVNKIFFISKIRETCSMFKYWWNRGAIENPRREAITRVKSRNRE